MNPRDELEIAERATPGPWRVNDDDPGNVWVQSEFGQVTCDLAIDDTTNPVADAPFIAHARTGYPLALKVVEAAQAWYRAAYGSESVAYEPTLDALADAVDAFEEAQ